MRIDICFVVVETRQGCDIMPVDKSHICSSSIRGNGVNEDET
jgi:hypothetical protein